MKKEIRIITEEQAYSRMARICSRKEYAPFDIKQKLHRLNLSPDQIESIIKKLKTENYLSEERFTRGFIKDKLHLNKWGKRKIEQALYQKKLPKELIEENFMEYDDEELSKSLQPILERKWKTIKGETDYIKTGKLIRFALSRGFEMNDITKCIDKMNLREIEND